MQAVLAEFKDDCSPLQEYVASDVLKPVNRWRRSKNGWLQATFAMMRE